MAANFLEELNEPQRAAAMHINGPMMVIAGAGSGKTRVLTCRIAHLIEQGIDPFHILALTFTNKAAREMKERIGALIGEPEARNIWMGTFHSIFARILRIENEKINYPRNFSIYDTADSRNLLKDIIREMNLDDKLYKPGVVHHRISSCKNNLISSLDYQSNSDIIHEDHAARRPRLADIYAAYEIRLFKSGAMDFDDLLFKTNVLLRDHPDVLHRYQHKFRYILVDEYQDTNFSQYLIVKQLAAASQNVCVVGDDAQSIYAFRGANIQNILNFRQDYPDYALFKLEQNYRSTKTIVEAANSIIKKNKDQIKKTVWTSNETGGLIRVHRSLSDHDEGAFVAHQIFSTHREEGGQYTDFAVLYRTNAQSRSFEEALRKLNIPYIIYGGISFYQRKEIKDLLAYFRLAANPNDEEALKRIINYPLRGIGNTTIEKLVVGAADRQIGIWEMLTRSGELKFNAGTWSKLNDFVSMIRSFSVELEMKNAYDMGSHIATSSGLMKELYSDRSPEGISRYENIQALLNGMKEFSDRKDPNDPEKINTLSDFLIDVALLTDVDNADEKEADRVSLMTIHGAKGLEFPYVHIVGMEENLFPSQMALNSREELEEERRLFYVALTRAKKAATLSYAMTRYRWGQMTYGEMSRFIEEIDDAYIERSDADKTSVASQPTASFANSRERYVASAVGPAPEKSASSPLTNMPPKHFKKVISVNPEKAVPSGDWVNPEDIEVGHEVMHEQFGKGKVLTIEGAAPNRKATIFFPKSGQRQLLLKFAKLKMSQ